MEKFTQILQDLSLKLSHKYSKIHQNNQRSNAFNRKTSKRVQISWLRSGNFNMNHLYSVLLIFLLLVTTSFAAASANSNDDDIIIQVIGAMSTWNTGLDHKSPPTQALQVQVRQATKKEYEHRFLIFKVKLRRAHRNQQDSGLSSLFKP